MTSCGKTHCWPLWNSPFFLSQLDCSQHCLLAWSHTWKGELLLPSEQAEGKPELPPLHQWSQVLNQQVLCHLQGRALKPSKGTPGWHQFWALSGDRPKSMIYPLDTEWLLQSFITDVLLPILNSTEMSFSSRQIEKWEVALEGLTSTPQKLLGTSRKDSESGNIFRSKPLALTGHPGIH